MISTIPLTLFSYDFLNIIVVSILLIAFVSFLHANKYTSVNDKQQPSTTNSTIKPIQIINATTTPKVKQPIQTINTITTNKNENNLSPTLFNNNHDKKLINSLSENDKKKQLFINTINIPDNHHDKKKTTNVVIDDLKKDYLNTLSSSPLPLDTLYEESSNNKDMMNDNDERKDLPIVTLLSTKCRNDKDDHHQKPIVKEVEKQRPLSLQPSYSTPPTSTLYYRRRQRSNSQFLSHIEITENKRGNGDDHDNLLTTPLLSPSLSTSTTASNDSWSLSKVESLVNQFEHKVLISDSKLKLHQQQQYQSSGLKRRSFAFKPIVENWENRIPKDKPYIAPTPSMSTPVWTNRHR